MIDPTLIDYEDFILPDHKGKSNFPIVIICLVSASALVVYSYFLFRRKSEFSESIHIKLKPVSRNETK